MDATRPAIKGHPSIAVKSNSPDPENPTNTGTVTDMPLPYPVTKLAKILAPRFFHFNAHDTTIVIKFSFTVFV